MVGGEQKECDTIIVDRCLHMKPQVNQVPHLSGKPAIGLLAQYLVRPVSEVQFECITLGMQKMFQSVF